MSPALLLSGPGEPTFIPLFKERLFFGTAQGGRIVWDTSRIAKTLSIEMHGETVWAIGLSKSQPLHINDLFLYGPCLLQDLDLLSLGGQSLVYLDTAKDWTDPAQHAALLRRLSERGRLPASRQRPARRARYAVK